MNIAHMIALLATGAVAGFAGGMLGIGGGFIMTPVQYMVARDIGIPTDMAIKLAFGTNLLVVLPTAISGVWRHNKKGVVLWRAAIIMGICGIIVAFIGATLASILPGQALKTAFGALAIFGSLRMMFIMQPKVEPQPVTNPWHLALWSVPVGLVTGLLGIGGGIIMVPVMVLVLKFPIHNAVATSLAVMILTSIGGVSGYIINGLNVPNLPPYSIGYVNLQTWLLLSIGAVSMAQVGAITAHKLPAKLLRYIFVALTFYMGLKMLGVFDWLGLPI